MFYGFLADLVVMIHVAYAGFVVLGFLLILLGIFFRWSWVRNFWFRLAHVIAIGIVAVEEVIGMRCPLTVWEEQLRMLAGQAVSGETFMSRLMRSILFWDCPAMFFTIGHIAVALVIIATFVLAPPRRPAFSVARS